MFREVKQRHPKFTRSMNGWDLPVSRHWKKKKFSYDSNLVGLPD